MSNPKPTPQEGRANLVSAAYARLKDDILANRLPPGFQSPEPEMAARLGMSRTPVREALLRLEADGLIELVPRRGARILPVSVEDMREIYEILTALEPEAAALLAARKPSSADLDDLEAANADMEEALAREDLDAWGEADRRFHRGLLELQDNRRLTAVVERLSDQAHRVRTLTLRLREKPVRSTREHRRILEHIRAGEADDTRRVFRDHRQRSGAELLAILESYRLPSL